MKKFMELNKETASRLWVKQFGKRQKAMDFSGREIAKAAYNDRNSAYGWNVDHILPRARGGKTADHNLICCHILTNDEKADKFPCFKSNAKEFEIQRRQNHYEIIARSAKQEEDETVNFLDAAQGLKCWKQCKSHNENAFAGYVKVRVETVDVTASESDLFFDRYGRFLSELFGTDCIFAEDIGEYIINKHLMYKISRTCIFTVVMGNIPSKEDTQNFLDDCVILNTYNGYFTRKKIFKSIQIVCGMERYNSYFAMYSNYIKDIRNNKVQFTDSLIIGELVRINTDAEEKLKGISSNGFYPYDFTYTNLEKNLAKRI